MSEYKKQKRIDQVKNLKIKTRDDRAIIELYLEGMSYDDISEKLGQTYCQIAYAVKIYRARLTGSLLKDHA